MTTLGLAGVLFCKISRNGQNGLSFVLKKLLASVPKEARRFQSNSSKRQQLYCHFIHTVFFLLLSVSFRKSVVFPSRPCSKPFQHIAIGPSQAEL